MVVLFSSMIQELLRILSNELYSRKVLVSFAVLYRVDFEALNRIVVRILCLPRLQSDFFNISFKIQFDVDMNC